MAREPKNGGHRHSKDDPKNDRHRDSKHDHTAVGGGRSSERYNTEHRKTIPSSKHSDSHKSRVQESVNNPPVKPAGTTVRHKTPSPGPSSTKVSRANSPADVGENSRSRSTIRKNTENPNHADSNEKTHSATRQSPIRSSSAAGRTEKTSHYVEGKKRAPSTTRQSPSRSTTESTQKSTSFSALQIPVKVTKTTGLRYKELNGPDLQIKYNIRRIIVVGDLHGEYEALMALLKAIGYNPDTNLLVLVGDLMWKDIEASLKIVDFARAVKAIVIRGNHEDWLLHVEKEKKSGWVEKTEDRPNEKFIRRGFKLSTPKDNEKKQYEALTQKVHGLTAADKAKLNEEALEPEKLFQKRMKFFMEMPHLLIMTNVGGYNRIGVLHAGMNPYCDLMDQYPIVAMNIKSVNPTTKPETCSWLGRKDKEQKEGYRLPDKVLKPWYEVWNEEQKKLSESERTAIIYGHDAKNGLQIRNYSYGIDTGVHRPEPDMGILTAVVIDATSCKVEQVIKDKDNKWILKV
ncbi:ser thr phosphatase family protein [Rutstroemia sp. NJR-2017a BVV2]|nr:ser thr phosphatase family protein [Rutstroemia sp. NJR-2017a BVV2]